MSNVPMKLVVDCETGETTEVPLTAEEIAIREAAAESETAYRNAMAEKEVLRQSAQAKLAALGLTADEIAALS